MMQKQNRDSAQGETTPKSAPNSPTHLSFDDELVHGYYVQVPSALLRSPDLSLAAKTLYGLLLTYAGEKSVAWPGQETLCGQMGVSERTLRTAQNELKAVGLITVQRGGDGKNACYHVRKVESRPAKNAPSETTKLRSDRQKTHGLKQSVKIQTGKKQQGRPAKNDTSYKEELETDILETATICAPEVQTPQAISVDILHAAADSVKNQKPESKPSKLNASLPGSEVCLLDYADGALERLRKVDPAELVRRFRVQNPSYAERIAKKAATAHTSPNPLLAVCIVKDWLPELRALRDALPPAPKPKAQPDPREAAFAKRFAHLYGGGTLQ